MTESKLPAEARDALIEAGWACYGELPAAISLCDEHWGKGRFVAYVYEPKGEPGRSKCTLKLEGYGELADGVSYKIGMYQIQDSLNPEVLDRYCKKMEAMMEANE